MNDPDTLALYHFLFIIVIVGEKINWASDRKHKSQLLVNAHIGMRKSGQIVHNNVLKPFCYSKMT